MASARFDDRGVVWARGGYGDNEYSPLNTRGFEVRQLKILTAIYGLIEFLVPLYQLTLKRWIYPLQNRPQRHPQIAFEGSSKCVIRSLQSDEYFSSSHREGRQVNCKIQIVDIGTSWT
jgi:hypothetical protein